MKMTPLKLLAMIIPPLIAVFAFGFSIIFLVEKVVVGLLGVGHLYAVPIFALCVMVPLWYSIQGERPLLHRWFDFVDRMIK